MSQYSAPSGDSFAHHYADTHPTQKHANWGLTLGALGVVFGDIGTSPLYTLRECFTQTHSQVDEPTVFGFLSLIFWALTFVVSFKYVYFLMKANNRGEGGIMALAALALQGAMRSPRRKLFIIAISTLGLALFYGDGVITPAISLLSAVEGIATYSPRMNSLVLPVTLLLLVGLFAIQRKGTRWLGYIAGPVMMVWFTVLGALGLYQVVQMPEVFQALNPVYGFNFVATHGWASMIAIGAVVLCLTGAEAVYSDMGHYGPRPIQRAWYWLAYPGLILCYFGQGVLLLKDPSTIDNPFYHLVPNGLVLPLVGLATLATVVASQAVITGAFSLSNQAIRIGLLPRMQVRHTDALHKGQIYVPQINWMLMIGVILLVLGFQSSGALAEMYGVAVTGTMLSTSIILLLVMRHVWRRSRLFLLLVGGLFILVDIFLFSSTLLKVHHGGYVSLLIAGLLFAVMMTWRTGRDALVQRRASESLPLHDLISRFETDMPQRVPGTAVYMAYDADVVPYPMIYNLKHNKVLHECVLLFTVRTEERPTIPDGERFIIAEEKFGIWHVIMRAGFMESPRVMTHLRRVVDSGLLPFDIDHATFFVGRDRMVMSEMPVMARWRMHLFFWMFRNAISAADFYRLPPAQVLEIGTRTEL